MAFKTGEDLSVKITIDVKDENDVTIPIGNFVQIAIMFYYLVGTVKHKFSRHALAPAEVGMAAEALAECFTVNQITMVVDEAQMVISKTETDNLLAEGQEVSMYATITVEDGSGTRTKMNTDLLIGTLAKDAAVDGWF